MTDYKRPLVIMFAAMVCYIFVLGPFTAYMKAKPIEEKLGYIPTTKVFKYSSADHRELAGAALIMKVIVYYGGIAEKTVDKIIVEPPDYSRMSGILHGAVQLDPYNMDAYYFAQSFLTWEVKQYQLANNLLDYGMKYRTWDWMLPFFAGFNSAYFLKDYKMAAGYYKRAGEISGGELNISLAGRYMQESGQTDLAISYLSAMEKGERNQAVKKNYQIRLTAFKEVRRIELAHDRYIELGRGVPVTIEQLVLSGLLSPPPIDPYGGTFYLEPGGKVATTSKFAFSGVAKDRAQKESK